MKNKILDDIMFNDNWMDAGLEANIAIQNDQPFINDCLEQLYKINGIYKDNKNLYKDSEALFNYSKIAKEALNKLGSILTKRFGINFNLLADTSSNACVFPVTLQNYNVINSNSENIKELIIQSIEDLKYLNSMEEKPEVINQDSTMRMTTTSGLIKIYESFLKSTEAIENTLRSSKVEFDLKNASIKNLPETMMSVLAVDYVSFFEIMSVEEILAIIMHEVGHQYTHLLNMYRISRTNTVLKDVMKNAVEEKFDKVNMTLAKEFNLTIPKCENLSTDANIKDMTIFIESLMNKATYVNTNESKLSTRDSEALADQFATKFGLEKELFSALNKIHSSYNEADVMLQEPLLHIMMTATAILLIITIILAYVILSAGVTSGFLVYILKELIIITASVKSISQIIAIGHMLFRFMLGDMDSWEMVYDDKKRRLERIRNDAIRNLRSISATGVDKDLIKYKLDAIYEMDDIIAETRKGRSLIAIFGEMIFPWQRKHSTETIYQQTLENLEANKLTLLSEKFK